MTKQAPGLNMNSVLLTLVLALCTWTLKTVVEQGTTLAITVEKVAQGERDILELRSRLNAEERDKERIGHYSSAGPVRPNT